MRLQLKIFFLHTSTQLEVKSSKDEKYFPFLNIFCSESVILLLKVSNMTSWTWKMHLSVSKTYLYLLKKFDKSISSVCLLS